MSPLQLNNAITWYKSTLRECKTVGQRKETNILRNVISLFLLPDCVSCSPVIRCCPMWPPQGIFWPIGLLKELEGHMRRTLRLYVTANDWWYNKEFDWVERQTLAENLKVRGKHNYLFPEGPVFQLWILSYSWKLWSWKFIKPRCNGGRRSTFETVSLLDVVWPRGNQWERALVGKNFQLYSNWIYATGSRSNHD